MSALGSALCQILDSLQRSIHPGWNRPPGPGEEKSEALDPAHEARGAHGANRVVEAGAIAFRLEMERPMVVRHSLPGRLRDPFNGLIRPVDGDLRLSSI